MNTRIAKMAAVLLPFGLAVLANTATAGDHHKGATLRCADCHVMHFSQGHGYNADGSGFYWLGTDGPQEHLLRAEVNNLCLSCHDGSSFAPDVLGTNNGNDASDVRLAGHLNRLGVGNPGTGHTLDSTADAPGSDPAWSNPEGLNCIDCHHQHGYAGRTGGISNNSYRNLKHQTGNDTAGGGLITYNDTTPGVNDQAKDVFQRSIKEYDESGMDWNEPDTTSSAIAGFCGGCHTNFHGTPGDANIGGTADGTSYSAMIRHPVSGVDIGDIGGGHSSLSTYNSHLNKVKVMSSAGVWDPAGDDVTPTCISCHKAHGNDNAFGLLYRSGGGLLTEEGDAGGSQLEHLCGQCHSQASAFMTTI